MILIAAAAAILVGFLLAPLALLIARLLVNTSYWIPITNSCLGHWSECGSQFFISSLLGCIRSNLERFKGAQNSKMEFLASVRYCRRGNRYWYMVFEGPCRHPLRYLEPIYSFRTGDIPFPYSAYFGH